MIIYVECIFTVNMQPVLKLFVRMDDNWTSDATDRTTSRYRMSSVKIRKDSIPLTKIKQNGEDI